MFLKTSQNWQENTYDGVSCRPAKIKAPTQVFSCQFHKIFENTFFTVFTDHLPATAFE